MEDSRRIDPGARERVLRMAGLECSSPALDVVSAACGAAAGMALLVLVAWMAHQSRLARACCLCRCRRRRAPRGHLQPPMAPAPPPRPARFLLVPSPPTEDEGYVTPTARTAPRHSYLLVLADDQQVPHGISPARSENASYPQPPGTWSGEPGYLPMRNYPYTNTCEEVLRIFQRSGIAVEMATCKESSYETPRDVDAPRTLASFQLPNPGLKEPASHYTVTGMPLHVPDFSEYVGPDPPNAEPLSCNTETNNIQARHLPPPPRPRPPLSATPKMQEKNHTSIS